MSNWQLEAEASVGRSCVARLHRLHNGLGLITAIDRRAPIVALQTWYRIGSSHERTGATGMAHLIEHLMFGQTEGLPPGDYDRLIARVGGETNAATWVDWTMYKVALPARDLALGVRLEAERMHRLRLEPDAFEAEREVVMNERRECIEDDLEGGLDEQLMAHAFAIHPYRHATVGKMEDLRTLSLEDVRAFYSTWYVPNNATLVCVGDFDEEMLLDVVDTHHGAIAASALPEVPRIVEPEQTAERIVRLRKPCASERLLVGYKVPGQRDPDWAPLAVVVTMLTGGPSARFYRRLVVELQAASSIDAQLTRTRDPSILRFSITTARGHHAGDIVEVLDRELAALRAQPADADEVEKAKALVEMDFWSALVDVVGKAEMLGHYHTTLGDFQMLALIADRLAAVTPADVERVIARYLRPEHRTLAIAEPEDAP